MAGLANGQTSYKLVGRYISSPLRWAIVTGKNSKYNSVDDLKGTTFGISRQGSGSQVGRGIGIPRRATDEGTGDGIRPGS